ncbi:MAG: asparagine synthase-related protein [Bacteroidetes bacterium]|nr:asparagine synthase-related protein [Bacteroidota bacterium]
MPQKHFLLQDAAPHYLLNNSLGFVSACDKKHVLSFVNIVEDAVNSISIVGEIRLYNKKEIQNKLNVTTNDDCTLVILSYLKWGKNCVTHFNGDFSFALWDAPHELLFCARDHFGQRPFFYNISADRFIFSSNLQTIFADDIVSQKKNEDWILAFAIESTVGATDTIYKDIHRLEAAQYMVVSAKEVLIEKYWDLSQTKAVPVTSVQDAIFKFKEELQKAVVRRLPAENENTNVAVELSGGLDSSALAAFSQQHLLKQNKSLTAYSAVFPESHKNAFPGLFDEWNKAQKVVDHLKIQKHFPVDKAATSTADLIDYEFKTLGYPGPFNFSLMQKALYDKCAENGDALIISGAGGDNCVSQFVVGEYYYTLAKERGKINKIFLQFKKSQNKAALRTLHFLVKYYLKMDKRAVKKSYEKLWAYKHVNKKLKAYSTIRQKSIEAKCIGAMHDVKQHTLHQLTNCGLVDRFETCYNMTNALGISCVYPLMDVELISFYYHLKDEWKANPEINRFLFRSAIKDLVPSEIVLQQKSSNFITIPYVLLEMEKDKQEMKNYFQNNNEKYSYIDAIELEKFTNVSPSDAYDQPYTYKDLRRHWQLSLFLNK